MITDGILLILQGILNILLIPLSTINVAVDFLGSIPVVAEFVQIVAYVLPWENLLPLFTFIFATFLFRAALALIKLVWHFIPVLGN